MKIKNSLALGFGIIFGINYAILIFAAFLTFIEYNSSLLLLIFHEHFSFDLPSLIVFYGLFNTYPFYYSFGGFFQIFGLIFYIPSAILFFFAGLTDKSTFIKTGFKMGLISHILNIGGGGLGLWMYIQLAGDLVQKISNIPPILILSCSVISMSLQSILFSEKDEHVSLINMSVEKLTDILQFCPNCGNNITKLDKFCSRCGTPVILKGKLSDKSKPKTEIT